jgi:hypothetical protein
MQQGVSAAVETLPSGESYLRRLSTELVLGLRHHALLFAGGGAVFALGYGLSLTTGHMLAASPMEFVIRYVLLAGLIVGLAIVLFKFARMAVVERPAAPIAELIRWLRFDMLSPARLANGANGMVFIFLLMGGFTMAKNNVSRFGGFHWDTEFAALDKALHFGIYPHDLLHPLLGHPWITFLLDRNYLLWFPVLFAACFVVAFQNKRSLERHRFLLALLLTWGIGGTLLAITFSSAGPVYFGRVTGAADPYTGLFAYLGEVNKSMGVKALEVQDRLWTALNGDPSMSLISAMPSMHSAISVLVCLGCWGQGRLLRIAAICFTTLILLASVHLGWHYAADAYAGIAIATIAWFVALPISRWHLCNQSRHAGEAQPR